MNDDVKQAGETPAPQSRRRWLSAIGTAAAGAALAEFAPADARAQTKAVDLQKLPHIDAHSHVWSPDIARWPLVNNQTKADLKPTSFTPEELFALAEPEGVGRVVLIQHSVYHLFDNSYLVDCARRLAGRFSIVGMIDDKAPRPDAKLRELLPLGVRGLRITPRVGGPKWLESPGMSALWKCGADTGQAMCCLIDATDLAAVAQMCASHPDTPVVIDHFARIGADGTIRDADIAALCNLARHKGVAVKLSAYYALGKKAPPYDDLLPMIRRLLDAFGPERCMWASDAPYQVQPPHTYAASIMLIRDDLTGLSPGDKEWLLHKTAERVFFS